jgi:prepilin-type N-terminal cleavage/methylation domain-containing protein
MSSGGIMFLLKKYNKGFTLIEILITVAIIGVLAAIVAVSFNKAQAKSRDTKRLSDLHDLQSALYLYKDDHHEFPPNVCGSAYCMIPPDTSTGYCPSTRIWVTDHWQNQGDTSKHPGDAGYLDGNCNATLFKELLDERYIDKLPRDPGKGTYYYYDSLGGGFSKTLISTLEVMDANTIADAYTRDDGDAGSEASWGCKMNLVYTDGTKKRNNSYCIGLK